MSDDIQNQIDQLKEQNWKHDKAMARMKERIFRLEYETGLVDVDTLPAGYEDDFPSTIKERLHKLETVSVKGALGVEAELSDLERILCGLKDEPPDSAASMQRAVAIGRIWSVYSDRINSREVLNVKRHKLKNVLSREFGEEISSKQLKRAMEAFVDMMQVGDTKKARIMLGQNDSNQLVIDYPEDVIWTSETLEQRLADE